MANDIARLASALTDYHGVLKGQHQRIRDAHAELAARFVALNAVYEGRGAGEFKAGWLQADATFDAYDEGLPPLLALLEGKVEQLRRLDEGF